MITPEQFIFFLDSGAFAAWTKGAVIDIDEYCAFIKANIEHLQDPDTASMHALTLSLGSLVSRPPRSRKSTRPR